MYDRIIQLLMLAVATTSLIPDASYQHSQRHDRAGFDQRARRKAGARGEAAIEQTAAPGTRLFRDCSQCAGPNQ
jgi:hypothetical protein